MGEKRESTVVQNIRLRRRWGITLAAGLASFALGGEAKAQPTETETHEPLRVTIRLSESAGAQWIKNDVQYGYQRLPQGFLFSEVHPANVEYGDGRGQRLTVNTQTGSVESELPWTSSGCNLSTHECYSEGRTVSFQRGANGQYENSVSGRSVYYDFGNALDRLHEARNLQLSPEMRATIDADIRWLQEQLQRSPRQQELLRETRELTTGPLNRVVTPRVCDSMTYSHESAYWNVMRDTPDRAAQILLECFSSPRSNTSAQLGMGILYGFEGEGITRMPADTMTRVVSAAYRQNPYQTLKLLSGPEGSILGHGSLNDGLIAKEIDINLNELASRRRVDWDAIARFVTTEVHGTYREQMLSSFNSRQLLNVFGNTAVDPEDLQYSMGTVRDKGGLPLLVSEFALNHPEKAAAFYFQGRRYKEMMEEAVRVARDIAFTTNARNRDGSWTEYVNRYHQYANEIELFLARMREREWDASSASEEH